MKFSAVIFTLLLAAHVLEPRPASAHTLGGVDGRNMPPPMKVRMLEANAAKEYLQGAATRTRAIYDEFKLWPTDSTLRVCFFDGDKELKDFFIQTSRHWIETISLKLNFGPPPNYFACNSKQLSHIRVSFAQPTGNWSFVGTDSLRHEVDGVSLNIGSAAGRPFAKIDRDEIAHLILHELGHALGVEHEHQSPESKCEAEFDWQKIYPAASKKWGWSKDDVDFNMRAIVTTPRLRTTQYDSKSIMHYFFAEWMLKKGRKSLCYVEHNRSLSDTDIENARVMYPPHASSQDLLIQKRADSASAILASQRLNSNQLSRVARELTSVVAQINRGLDVVFDLAKAEGTRAPTDPFPPLTDCGGKAGMPALTAVTCRMAVDGSGFAITVSPAR